MKKIVTIILGLAIAIAPLQAGLNEENKENNCFFENVLTSKWKKVFEMLTKNPNLVKHEHDTWGNVLTYAILTNQFEKAAQLISQFNANPYKEWHQNCTTYNLLQEKIKSCCNAEFQKLDILEEALFNLEIKKSLSLLL